MPSRDLLRSLLLFAVVSAPASDAQLVCHDGFGSYAANTQVESGSNGSTGAGLDGGAGWSGAYNVSNFIKSLVKVEDRSASPVSYTAGEIAISGGNRALRFYDVANGSHALHRSLGTNFQAAAGDVLWFSVLFRTATGGASPLANQDFFQLGFDDNEGASSGVPRVSIGSNASQSTFPSPARFFVRSTTAIEASAFHEGLSIAAATTYLLVGRVESHGGSYDSVSLFVNPTTLADPGLPSAQVVLPSGLTSMSHAFIRTVGLDNGDAYVLDEWHIGRDYRSVVQKLAGALRILSAEPPGNELRLRWPVTMTGAVLEQSTSLAPDAWTEVPGPFSMQLAEWEHPVPLEPGEPQRFFRLRR